MSANRDNQGRNLDAVKAHFEMLAKHRIAGEAHSRQMFEETVAKFPLADWVMFDNVLVLRAGQSRFVACPRNSKKSASNFDVIDVVAREPVTTLHKTKVYSWLWKASQNEEAVARGIAP
jgi:hypothetical protein